MCFPCTNQMTEYALQKILTVVHSYTFKAKITTSGALTPSELRGYSSYHSPFEIGDSFPVVRLFVQV